MRSTLVALAILGLVGCGDRHPFQDSSETTPETSTGIPRRPQLSLVVGGLELPAALAVRDGHMYVTEDVTGSGVGARIMRLSEVDPESGLRTPRIQDVENWTVATVLPSGDLVLGGGYPGDGPEVTGAVSLVRSGSSTEEPLVQLPLAIRAFAADGDDVLAFGDSMATAAPYTDIARLRGPGLTQSTIEAEDLAPQKTLLRGATDGEAWYFLASADDYGSDVTWHRWTPDGGVSAWTPDLPMPFVTGMVIVDGWAWVVSYNGLYRVALDTAETELVLDNLTPVVTIRLFANQLAWDEVRQILYFYDLGDGPTDGAIYQVVNLDVL